jgi:hypothetical protein
VTAVTPSREALEAVIRPAVHDTIDRCCTTPGGRCPYDDDEIRRVTEAVVAALIASGAVIPLDTLADDDALVEAVARDSYNRTYRAITWSAASGESQARWLSEFRDTFRALAAALSERGDR